MKKYLFNKVVKFKNYLESKKYELSPVIRKELIEFLKWNKPGLTDEEYSKLIDSYFTEKDFIWYGEFRKMHGTNTRSSAVDLMIVGGGALLGTIFVILFIYILS